MKRKQRSINQIKEEVSFQILREKLPAAWVIHEYGPDYGIDCVVELFDYVDADKNVAETLGENFFVQLKSSSSIKYTVRKAFSRKNVEKGPLAEDRSESCDIAVANFQLEMPEILTVQAMGPAVPVLLILVDVTTRRAFFVCLNDYIDKVMIPEDPAYADKESKTIFIPLANELIQKEDALVPLRAYGKRSKMYGAFGKFVYQQKEIERVLGLAGFNHQVSDESVLCMLRAFAEASLRQDIWRGHDFWEPVRWSYHELCEVKKTIEEGTRADEYQKLLDYCHYVWNRLGNLPNMYEELVREWFMPTFLGQLMSYPPK